MSKIKTKAKIDTIRITGSPLHRVLILILILIPILRLRLSLMLFVSKDTVQHRVPILILRL